MAPSNSPPYSRSYPTLLRSRRVLHGSGGRRARLHTAGGLRLAGSVAALADLGRVWRPPHDSPFLTRPRYRPGLSRCLRLAPTAAVGPSYRNSRSSGRLRRTVTL